MVLPPHPHAGPTIVRLEKAQSFAFGGVGYVSVTSYQELDYRAILSRNSAAADFETVFQFGNLQAKCYALTGLRQLNPSRFQALAAPLQSSTTCVPVSRGCVTINHPLAEILTRIRSGMYSGPLTHDVIPPPESPKPPAPRPEQTTWRRLLALFSVASSQPHPPPPPVGPPSPPPPAHRHASCGN